MTRIVAFLVALFAAASLTATALPQGPKGKGKDDKAKKDAPDGAVSLIKQKAVQKDLKLTAKQLQQVAKLTDVADAKQKKERDDLLSKLTPAGRQQEFATIVTNDEAHIVRGRVEVLVVEAILTPDQVKRFTEIRWQIHGPIHQPFAVGRYGGPPSLEPALITALDLKPDQFQTLIPLVGKPTGWKDGKEKFAEALTDAQKEKWKDALGKPFSP
jgi:hypothetical protein